MLKGITLADCELRPDGLGLDKPGEGSGCPVSEKEVAYFAKVLKANFKLTEADLAALGALPGKNEPEKTTGTN